MYLTIIMHVLALLNQKRRMYISNWLKFRSITDKNEYIQLFEPAWSHH